MSVARYLRFLDQSTVARYGEVTDDLLASGTLEGKEVPVLTGQPLEGFKRSGSTAIVQKVLCPVEHTPIVICIGLNYYSHAIEAKMTPAKVPVMFTKPANAVVGPYDDIPIHPIAQSELDYEAELCVIIGKDAKNVKEEEALDYVHGYTAGNDLSARNYQQLDMSGNQYCFAKSFDGFCPIGPYVATTKAIPDPQDVKFWLKVNGKTRQESTTADMIYSVKQCISHLSQGTTLKKGTVLMTGTPKGVGYFMEPSGAGFLKNDDVVDIYFEGIGTMSTKFVFEAKQNAADDQRE